MAEVAVMYKPHRNTLDGGNLGVLELEATVTETHSISNEITEHPVEDGSPVSDHIRRKPDGLVLEAIISNTPIKQGDQVALDGKRERGKPGPADEAYALLISLQGVLLVVATRLHTYESMAIESVSIPRDSKRGDALHFTVTLKEVKIVSSRAVSYAREPRGSKKAKLGNKPKKAAPAKTSESALHKLAGLAGGIH